MLVLLFILISSIIYCHGKYQSIGPQLETKFNFSDVDSNIRTHIPINADNIIEMIYFKANTIRFDLLSISTINNTIFSSQTFNLADKIVDIQFLESNDNIIAALSSQQVAVINPIVDNPCIFLDLMDCQAKLITPGNEGLVIIGCSNNSISTLNIINTTNNNPLKWYTHPITNIRYKNNDISTIVIDNNDNTSKAWISFGNESLKFDVNKMNFMGDPVPYSITNYFKLKDNKEIITTQINDTLHLMEIITDKANEFNIKPILLSSHYNNKNISSITSISCNNIILICYYDTDNNYFHIDINDINNMNGINNVSLFKIKTNSNTKNTIVNSNIFTFNGIFINRYKILMPSCRRTLQEETTEPEDKELDPSSYTKTKLDTYVLNIPDGLTEFFNNLDVSPTGAAEAYDCESEGAFDFEVSITYPTGIDLSYLVFQYFYSSTIPARPHIFSIYIYDDANGKPHHLLDHRIGIEAINKNDAPSFNASGGLEEITLDCPISLPIGLYWISIQGQITGPGWWGASVVVAGAYGYAFRSFPPTWDLQQYADMRVALFGTDHTGADITFPTDLYLDASQTLCTDKCFQSKCIDETDTLITNDNFCDDDKICTTDVCDFTDGCSNIDTCPACLECDPDDVTSDPITGCKAKVDGNTICDDGLEDTLDICVAAEGGCIHITNYYKDGVCPSECLEYDPSDDKSDPITGCKAKSNGNEICSDGNECTIDKCENDIGCKSSPIVCEDDGIGCTDEICDIFTGCSHSPNHQLCDDKLSCTVDICDINDGCSHISVNENCKASDVCKEGYCDVNAKSPGTGCVYNPIICPTIEACSSVECITTDDIGCKYSSCTVMCENQHPTTTTDKNKITTTTTHKNKKSMENSDSEE